MENGMKTLVDPIVSLPQLKCINLFLDNSSIDNFHEYVQMSTSELIWTFSWHCLSGNAWDLRTTRPRTPGVGGWRWWCWNVGHIGVCAIERSCYCPGQPDNTYNNNVFIGIIFQKKLNFIFISFPHPAQELNTLVLFSFPDNIFVKHVRHAQIDFQQTIICYWTFIMLWSKSMRFRYFDRGDLATHSGHACQGESRAWGRGWRHHLF